MNDETSKTPAADGNAPRKDLTPAARRALAEADARRTDYLAQEAALPKEIG
ncbi:DUF1674 domain-containing protein, partial [Mesorhizobium sp. M4B.F.Ca.ET.150.01.1.1]